MQMNMISTPVNRATRHVPTWIVYLAGLIPLVWIVWLVLSGGIGTRVDNAALKQAELTEHSRTMGEELRTLQLVKQSVSAVWLRCTQTSVTRSIQHK